MNYLSIPSLRNAVIIAGVAFALFFGLVYRPAWPDETRSILSNGFNIVLGLLATVFLYLASKHSSESKRVARSWRLLASAFLAYTTAWSTPIIN
jgi:hypothetical protein